VSVRGAGGYQMFGITPMPIFDPEQKTSYLRDFMVLFRPGDIVKFKRIGREEYDQMVADVEAGRFVPAMSDVTFDLREFQKDIDGYNAKLEGAIHGR
jgi:urea carboxylase